jgi:hypothetical protein
MSSYYYIRVLIQRPVATSSARCTQAVYVLTSSLCVSSYYYIRVLIQRPVATSSASCTQAVYVLTSSLIVSFVIFDWNMLLFVNLTPALMFTTACPLYEDTCIAQYEDIYIEHAAFREFDSGSDVHHRLPAV